MKREGRMYGSHVRIRRQQLDWVKAPAKPTNHSRITGRCPVTLDIGRFQLGHQPAHLGPQGCPRQKAIGKTRGEYRNRDNDVTRTIRLEEWRVCYASPTCDRPESSSFDADFEYYSDYEEPASGDESSSRVEETTENAQRQTDMVLPIESFLRSVRRVRRLPPVREAPSEEGKGDESSGADSDSSWSEVERSTVDLDDWYVVG